MNISIPKYLLQSVSYSMPTTDGRYPRAIQLTTNGTRARLVATNGHHLTAVQWDMPISLEPIKCLLPYHLIKMVLRIPLSEIDLSIVKILFATSPNQFSIYLRENGEQYFAPDEYFPNWQHALPTEPTEFPLGVPLLPVDPKYHVSAAKSIRAFLLWEHQIRATEGRFAWMQYLPIPLYHGQRNLPIYVTQIRDNFLHIIAPIERNPASGLNVADWAP